MSEPAAAAGSDVAARVAGVRRRIEDACARSGRDPGGVTLIGVIKQVPTDKALDAWRAGVTDFGENYVQEAVRRTAQGWPPKGARLHFIGHLQRNKVNNVTGAFALLHGIDSTELCEAVGRRACALGIVQDVLAEVRLDASEAKSGFAAGRLLDEARRMGETPGIRLAGLMGMPQPGQGEAALRAAFVTMRELFQSLPGYSQSVLSMGMSDDFEIAIEEGATHVRIGTALFGPRSPAVAP